MRVNRTTTILDIRDEPLTEDEVFYFECQGNEKMLRIHYKLLQERQWLIRYSEGLDSYDLSRLTLSKIANWSRYVVRLRREARNGLGQSAYDFTYPENLTEAFVALFEKEDDPDEKIAEEEEEAEVHDYNAELTDDEVDDSGCDAALSTKQHFTPRRICERVHGE